jgi:2-hydroxychromene-2-carboxylate isomerase
LIYLIFSSPRATGFQVDRRTATAVRLDLPATRPIRLWRLDRRKREIGHRPFQSWRISDLREPTLQGAGGSVGMRWSEGSGEGMARQIDYYFSLLSPWAYIGHKLFREVAGAHDLKINYKPVMLGDLFSETGGLPLSRRHPVRQRYRMLELQRWRDKRGLNFHLQPANWPFNGRLADGLVIAAIEAGHDPDPFLRRGFAAIWEDQRNLAEPATLIELADDSGLPGKKLLDRSASEEISKAYEQNRQDALAADVFGSPAYVLDGEVFWGQDRIELLEDALKSNRAPFRSQV